MNKRKKLIRFFKENNRWYVDIPNHSLDDNEMVMGSDTMLELLATSMFCTNPNEVNIELIDEKLEGVQLLTLTRIEHDEDGAYYKVSGILYREYVDMLTSETDINEIETVQTALLNTPRQKVIHESNRAYPFSVEVSFRGPCLFRYSPDRQDYIENFYKSGEQVSQTTNNGIRLWMSNSNALAIKVVADTSRIDLPVGAAGAVSVEEIKRVRDTEGKYKLVVVTLD